GGTASQVFDGKTYPGLKDWTLQMFLRWAQQDPVDDIERARNEAVYKLQKNRNPFVDFPELAEYVWGSKTDVPFSVSGEEPEPPTPPTPPGPPVVPADSTLLLYQYFSSDFGDFEAVASDGSRSRIWSVDEQYGAKVNAYTFGKTADDWLVSPSIDLTRMRGATLEFSHATGFNSAADASRMFEVLVSLDYDGRPADANWYPLEVVWPERPSDGYSAYVYSGQVSLNDYVGDHVRIAFRYRASAAQCWAWEIRNVTLKGKPLPDGVAAAPEAPSFRRIFDEQGRYLGHSLPPRPGVLVVREGQKTQKIIRR
ncbi:MAG: endonuclease, partial [Bacteroidaceae bacterium]|nr:endonuclease [Bacteroidaceae bacterium]